VAEHRGPIAPGDDLAIRNLVARLAVMADTVPIDQLDEYLACYTDDGVWESPTEVRRGIAEVRLGAEERRRSGAQGPGTHGRHVISTQAVWGDGPDRAVSESYFMAVGDTLGTPTPRVVGYYRDELARTPTGWRIAHRHVTFG
jgi:hypothetical protein